jgi:hypothetical protein
MMPANEARSKLYVEGRDDEHAIANLIEIHGIDYRKIDAAPKIEPITGVESLLKFIETAVEVSGGRAVGFVLDADAPLADRSASVRQHLVNAKVEDVPEAIPADGFIGTSNFKSRVGIWLMPDNGRDGTLEEFLRDLVAEHDSIIGHAESATDQAKTLGAGFPPQDHLKAVIHAWLAWQDVPGHPYGLAIKARSFQHDSPLATKFVAWFRTLYGLPMASTS